MNFLIFILFFSVGSAFGSTLRSFEDFFQEAIQKNDLYLSSFLDVESAQYRKKATMGLYAPNVISSYLTSKLISDDYDESSRAISFGLNGSLPHLGVSYGSTLYSDTKRFKPKPVNHLGSYNFDVSLDLLKNFAGKISSLPFQEVDLSLSLSKINRIKTTYSLFQNLLYSFTQAFASQKNMKVTKVSVERNKDELGKATEQFRTGKIPRLSLLSLQSQYQQMRAQVIGQKRTLLSSFQSLYILAGIDKQSMDTDVIMQELTPIRMPFFNEKIIDNLLAKEINFSSLKNPDYLSEKLTFKQSEFNVMRAQENTLPSLTLSYTLSGSENNSKSTGLFPQDTKGSTIALSLSFPFGFIAEKNELSAVKNEYKTRELRIQQLEKKLLRDWENLSAQYLLLKEQLEISKELLKASKERYQASLATASLGPTYQQNVILFQNEWVSNEIQLNQMEADLIIAQFEILAFHGHPHIFKILNNLKQVKR